MVWLGEIFVNEKFFVKKFVKVFVNEKKFVNEKNFVKVFMKNSKVYIVLNYK